MLRLPQNGRLRCNESSNVSGKIFSLSSTAAKTRRSVHFQVSFDYTDRRFKAASCTFVKKNDGNVQHYFKDEFDFWNDWLSHDQ